ncbi:3-methyl-2-oxobutanoate hydroxymethyltransferase [Candidatus Poribacteria bacterium]|nr:3-methyl-2-oxobutanoate hydroxymethyltransferase [Candidatus Poribacteria bacterium]
MKRAGRPIAMITAYDTCFAAIADESGMDVILVGDSLGMVVHGFETTLPVTMDMTVLHTQAVVRGAPRALVVADMPFMSYQTSTEEAVRNAGRLMKEGGAQAVKLEARADSSLERISAIVDAGIPVMGHLGLVPQSIHALSGYRVQGRQQPEAERLIKLAAAQERAGAFAIVLECVPRDLASRISSELTIPTIGIGAGAGCDGQVLVMHDMLGFTQEAPKFVRKYANLRAGALRAFRKYARDVRERSFPAEENTYD